MKIFVLPLILLIEFVLLESSLSQECQVVLTTQQELNKQIRAVITSSSDFINDGSTSTDATYVNLLLEEIGKMGKKLEVINEKIRTLDAINEKIDTLQKRMNALHDLGLTPCHAASSCVEVLNTNPNSTSGYYWVSNSTGHTHSVYCDMTRSCGNVTGGWTRVAYLNSSHQCPSSLRQRTDSNIRTCAVYSNSGSCSSVLYGSHGIHYSQVCGKIKGYSIGSVDGFINDYRGTRASLATIDSNYVDGAILTHGNTPRHHIWTFAARYACGCGDPPSFVNNDYFCDGNNGYNTNLNNPLWDGEGCASTCSCTFNNPPWFHRQLPQPTTDDIEMKLCRDQVRFSEDVLIEAVEIYVQ